MKVENGLVRQGPSALPTRPALGRTQAPNSREPQCSELAVRGCTDTGGLVPGPLPAGRDTPRPGPARCRAEGMGGVPDCSPVEGGAGAVVDHLAVALHLQVGVAVVAPVVLELVDGLQARRAVSTVQPGPAPYLPLSLPPAHLHQGAEQTGPQVPQVLGHRLQRHRRTQVASLPALGGTSGPAAR